MAAIVYYLDVKRECRQFLCVFLVFHTNNTDEISDKMENSIFSTLPQSEYTSREIFFCVYFCLLSIRCFNVVQPETRFHFQSANQIAKTGQNFQKFHIKFHNFQKISKFKLKKKSKFSKISYKISKIPKDFKIFVIISKF